MRLPAFVAFLVIATTGVFAEETSVAIVLTGEAKGIRVTLDLGKIPDQSIDVSGNATPSILLTMTVESSVDTKMNGLADRLAFAFNGQMAETRLISFSARRSYPKEILAGTKATFEVEVFPVPFAGFAVGIPVMKAFLLRARAEDSPLGMDLVRRTFQGKFYLWSLDLDIPMHVEVSFQP